MVTVERPSSGISSQEAVSAGILWNVPLAFALAAWLAGSGAMLAAEVLIFPDLPRPPRGYLLGNLLGTGLYALPVGLIGGLICGLLLRLVRGHRRPRLLQGLLAALLCFAPIGSMAVILFAARTLSRPGVGVLLGGGAILALLVAVWSARQAMRRRWIALTIIALTGPLWLTLLSLLAPAVSRPGTPLPSAEGRHVVLLGFDGATWDLMQPLIEKGELPHVAELMARGTYAPLRSLEPMLSNPVWTSAATGVVPERHGITDFFSDRRLIQVPTMWDLVHQLDGRVGTCEYLVTDPPVEVNGFMLPGWTARDPGATHPPRLTRRRRILASVHHPLVAARYLWQARGDDPRRHSKEFVRATYKATAFIDLSKRFAPDLSAIIWYGTDVLGHLLWRYHEPAAFSESLQPEDRVISPVFLEYYRSVDRELGRVVDALDDGRTLFLLMSDHGMGPRESGLLILGYIKGPATLAALGLTGDFYVESPMSELILNCRVEGRSEDWTVPKADHARVVDDAAHLFRSAIRAGSDIPLFEVEILDRRVGDLKLRVHDTSTLSPDTPVELGEQRLRADEVITFLERSGTHRMEGILVMAGNPVEPRATLEDPSVLDIAPTILHVLGLPVAEDLDGRVIREGLDVEWAADHPVQTVSTYGETDGLLETPEKPTEELLEKLRSLGYLD